MPKRGLREQARDLRKQGSRQMGRSKKKIAREQALKCSSSAGALVVGYVNNLSPLAPCKTERERENERVKKNISAAVAAAPRELWSFG